MTADLKNEAQKALDAYDKYESHRDALQFAAAIESLRKAVELQAPAEGAPEISLAVIKGELCYMSKEDDQSFGMWVPVAPNADHGFADGTVFVISKAQPKGKEPAGQCCERASGPGQVCDECAATSAAYSADMAPVRTTPSPAPAQCTPALKRHALEAADRLAMYAAAPFFPDTEKRGVKRATTAEWWDGLAELIEEAQPLIKRGLHECTAPLADLQASAVAHQGGVDCIGLALDLEARAKTVESQTTERAMKAAAHGLRLLASSQTHAVAHGDGDANDMRSPTDHIDIAVALLETWARGDPAPLDRADARPVVIARLQSARAAIQASGIDAKP